LGVRGAMELRARMYTGAAAHVLTFANAGS